MILDKRELYRISRSRVTVGFGAGVTAEKTLHIVQDAFDYFVDNDKEVQGTIFENRPVCAPEKLLEEDRDKLFIVICTTLYEELAQQLTVMGFEPGRHFGYTPLLNSVLAFNRLDQGSTRLLVSGYGSGGGLMSVNSRTGEYSYHQTGAYRGLTRVDEAIYVLLERDGIQKIDPVSLEVLEHSRYDNFFNALGIAHCPHRDRFYITLAQSDEILIVDRPTMKEVGRLKLFHEKYSHSRKEQHHLNDLLVVDEGRRLLVSMFSLAGYWRKNVYDGSVVEVDIDNDRLVSTLITGMVKPHSIHFFEDDLFLLDSFRGRFYRGSDNVVAEFNGFVRGLERDQERYYIGLSRNRHIEESYRLNKTSMANPGMMVYLESDRVYKFIELPMSDVYTIHDLSKDGM